MPRLFMSVTKKAGSLILMATWIIVIYHKHVLLSQYIQVSKLSAVNSATAVYYK